MKDTDPRRLYVCSHCLDRVMLAHMMSENSPRGPRFICVACALMCILNVHANKRLKPEEAS